MSEPKTFEFAVIQVGDGATPSEVFTTICGIQTTGFNRSVQTNDRYVRDCAAPAKIPERKVRVTGRSRTLTGSGLYNTDQTALINGLEGRRRNYKFRMIDIATDPADLDGIPLGTWSGPGVATSIELGTSDNDDASISITIQSDGEWTYTANA